MALRIYSTLTKQKELFEPLIPGQVRVYVCGITAYDLCHIGHGRSAIVFDVIRRYLEFKGYQVKFVKNFTDVDDKIIKRASEEGVSPNEVSERYIAEYQNDMENLGVLPAHVEPKATEYIPQMIRLIERLLARGFAYVVDGNVYFEVRQFPRYGRLSGKNLDELLVGARVEVDERKRDPRDFALWKAAKPGEPSWESPWGPGRPGWHIECSAMSTAHLGESFDIHGGGEDLIFPHHECEIAQSEAATDRPFARYWVHNGFVNLGAEKMSKSLGNILTIKELVRHHDPEALRLWLLGTHYRNSVEFSEERVREAKRALDRLCGLVEEAKHVASSSSSNSPDGGVDDQMEAARSQFEAAMNDDFNTPQALAAIFDLSRALYAYRDRMMRGQRAPGPFVQGVDTLVSLAGTLGLLQRYRPPLGGFISEPLGEPRRAAPAAYELYNTPVQEGPIQWAETRAKIESLIVQRDEARRRRDWRRADEIRAEIESLGAIVEDTPAGTRWKWKGA